VRGKPEIFILVLVLGLGFVFKNEIEVAVLSDGDWFVKYDSLIKAKSKKYNLPWKWIKAVALNESRLGTASSVAWGLVHPSDIEKSKSSDGKSWGLMQLTLPTAREMVGAPITASYLNNAENSLELGARYLSQMYNLGLKQSVVPAKEFMFRAYNGGPGFLKTNMGKVLTPIYYAKAVTNIGLINSRQGGDEMEIG